MSHEPDVAEEFYGKLFGWTFTPGPPELGTVAIALLRGLPVAGIGRRPGEELPSTWTGYLAADSADAVATEARSNGGTVAVGPLHLGDEGRLAIAADPMGAPFGIWESGRFDGAAVMDEPGAVAWIELVTEDAATAAAFYGPVFGLRTERQEAGGPADGDYVALLGGGGEAVWIRGVSGAATALGPRWLVFFRVADPDAAVERASALGGQVRIGVRDFGHGRAAVLEDPVGALFGVVGPVERGA